MRYILGNRAHTVCDVAQLRHCHGENLELPAFWKRTTQPEVPRPALRPNTHARCAEHTLPDPLTPSVARSASVPSPPCGARTPSTRGTTLVQWKTSSWVASSVKTWVKANFSTARLRSFGGLRVMWVGAADGLSVGEGSTARKRSVVAAPA